MRCPFKLHGDLIENRTDLESAITRIFADVLRVLPHKQRLHRTRFRKRIARIHVLLHYLGHAACHDICAIVSHHDVVKISFHRLSLAQALPDLIQKSLLNAHGPAKLLEVHRTHDQLLDVTHWKRRDPFELGTQHGA